MPHVVHTEGIKALSAILNNAPINVVDIGASPIDAEPPYKPLLDAGAIKLVGFEPNAHALASLNAHKTHAETYLPYAIGDGENHTYHVCAAPGMNSLFKPNAEFLNYLHGFPDWGAVTSTRQIRTHRLDDIAEVGDIDMLKIDVQGAELMIFRHGVNKISDAVVIHTEVEFMPMYEGQPLFGDVDAFLRGMGFVLHKFSPLTTRAIAPLRANGNPYVGFGQLVWADAVYIKDFTKFSLLSAEKLRRLAVILYAAYHSYDVAICALLAADKQDGGASADVLINAIRALEKPKERNQPEPLS